MRKKYPLFEVYWNRSDIKAVSEVIRRGTHWAIGPEIELFEKQLEKYFGSKHVVVFNSGTSALYSALIAYGITSGEVIVPSFTFIATINCVLLAGATPVFADIEKDTMGLDYEDVKSKVTRKTRAILPMHYGGRVCRDIELLQKLADDKKILLIEDNAESFGAKMDGKMSGTFGHCGISSFCQNKIITTGEGGMVNTNDTLIYEKLLLLRSHGRVNDKNYFSKITESAYIMAGHNFRMSSINAALGISQLKKIKTIIELRREIGQFYDEQLKDIPQIKLIPELSNQKSVYQLYSILIEDGTRNKLQKYLLKKNIYAKIYFYPISQNDFYMSKYNISAEFLFNTEDISETILSLPMSLNYTEKDQINIVKCIKHFYGCDK
jgi:perosamine synthetase